MSKSSNNPADELPDAGSIDVEKFATRLRELDRGGDNPLARDAIRAVSRAKAELVYARSLMAADDRM